MQRPSRLGPGGGVSNPTAEAPNQAASAAGEVLLSTLQEFWLADGDCPLPGRAAPDGRPGQAGPAGTGGSAGFGGLHSAASASLRHVLACAGCKAHPFLEISCSFSASLEES